jgi:hypothetical protein
LIIKMAVAVASLLTATSASAGSMTSGKWFCRAESMVSCDENLVCQKGPSRVTLLIDIDTMTFKGLNVGGELRPLRVIGIENNIATYSTGAGNMFEIGSNQNKVGERGFRLTSYLGPKINTHIGQCGAA